MIVEDDGFLYPSYWLECKQLIGVCGHECVRCDKCTGHNNIDKCHIMNRGLNNDSRTNSRITS